MTHDEALAIGRQRWPDLAQREREAMDRLRDAVCLGEIATGSHAIEDWIDTRALMIVMVRLAHEGPRDR